MSHTAIKIENVSKLYRLGVYGARTLREDFQRWWWKVKGKGDPLAKIDATNTLESTDNKSYVWALRDINIDVAQGEVLGIIGKNGAGKSTLLKILSRVTLPTEGAIKIKGRIGSLLEVGTGFHPELTGRENIFLNGAILGMKRWEINRKFDDIVDFAGVAKYIDTPVKRYSSGMRVRLGFAVAAFLEPEILVVDEVLAVGDAEFQKRAIGKMQDVSRSDGRTVLFVSHNMGSIRKLCQRTVVLDKGKVIFDGDTGKAIEKYLKQSQPKDETYLDNVRVDLLNNCQTEGLKITELKIENLSGKEYISSGDSFRIVISYKRTKSFPSPAFVLQLTDQYGLEIARFSNLPISGYELKGFKQNYEGKVILDLYDVNLVKGMYYISIGFVHESIQWYFKCENIIKLEIEGKDVYNSGLILDRSRGLIFLKHKWHEEV